LTFKFPKPKLAPSRNRHDERFLGGTAMRVLPLRTRQRAWSLRGYIRAIAKLEASRNEAFAERDEAVAERDYMVKFLHEMGEGFNKSRNLGFEVSDKGVEIRSLYPSRADALAVANHVRTLRRMTILYEATKPQAIAAINALEAQAAAELRA
jgi:hypothetical protein